MKVFISYAAQDEPEANKIKNRLQNYNKEISFTLPVMNAGDHILHSIGNAIEDSDAVLFILSKHTKKNEWASQEISIASYYHLERNLNIIPVVIDKDVEIPFFLKNMVYFDLSSAEEFDTEIEKLARVISNKDSVYAKDDLLLRKHIIEMESIALRIKELEHMESQNRKNRKILLATAVFTTFGAAIAGLGLVVLLANIEVSLVQLALFLVMSVLIFSMAILIHNAFANKLHHDFKIQTEELRKKLTEVGMKNV